MKRLMIVTLCLVGLVLAACGQTEKDEAIPRKKNLKQSRNRHSRRNQRR